MTLTQLQVFLMVVETGNFTRAAERLYMTQSAVSHALATLERELGIVLLERHRTGVTVTAVGEQVLRQARRIVEAAEGIRQATAAARGGATGKLRIGSFPSVSKEVLSPLLNSFRRRYPGIEVTLVEGTDREVYDWLVACAVDLSVVTLPQARVMTIPLASDEMVAVLPTDHRFAKNATIHIEQIGTDPFIMSKGGCEPLIRAIFERVGCAPQVAFEASETRAVLALVEEGLGVTMVPRFALPAAVLHASILSLDPPTYRQLGLAVRPQAALAPAMKAFLQHVETR